MNLIIWNGVFSIELFWYREIVCVIGIGVFFSVVIILYLWVMLCVDGVSLCRGGWCIN